MTMAQLCALIDAENARNDAPAGGPAHGTASDLLALAGMARG
jgi:hypothetical protein